MLSLFLTLLILITVGGAVSVVGAASHVIIGQVSKPTVTAASCPFVGNAQTHVYHYAGCYWATIIKPKIECVLTPRAIHRPLVTDHANTVSQSVTRREIMDVSLKSKVER